MTNKTREGDKKCIYKKNKIKQKENNFFDISVMPCHCMTVYSSRRWTNLGIRSSTFSPIAEPADPGTIASHQLLHPPHCSSSCPTTCYRVAAEESVDYPSFERHLTSSQHSCSGIAALSPPGSDHLTSSYLKNRRKKKSSNLSGSFRGTCKNMNSPARFPLPPRCAVTLIPRPRAPAAAPRTPLGAREFRWAPRVGWPPARPRDVPPWVPRPCNLHKMFF